MFSHWKQVGAFDDPILAYRFLCLVTDHTDTPLIDFEERITKFGVFSLHSTNGRGVFQHPLTTDKGYMHCHEDGYWRVFVAVHKDDYAVIAEWRGTDDVTTHYDAITDTYSLRKKV